MSKTRATNQDSLCFDPEIERTFHRLLRKSDKTAFEKKDNEESIHEEETSPEEEQLESSSDEEEMAQTLKELTAPDLTQQPLCIKFPALTAGTNFEMKSSLLHRLLEYNGRSGEDPNKFLTDFEFTCTSMKPTDVTDE